MAGRGAIGSPFLRFPKASLLATLAVCLPLFLRLGTFQVDSDADGLLAGDQRNLSSYRKAIEMLADSGLVIVSMTCDEVFSAEAIGAIRRVSEAFEREPGVMGVKSLTHSVRPVRRGLSFQMEPLVPPVPAQKELDDLKAFALGHPLIRDVMVSADSRRAVITVTYGRDLKTAAQQRELREEVEGILAPFREEGYRFHTVGLPLIEDEIRASLWRDIRVFVPLAALLALGVLWGALRSWRLVAFVLMNLAVTLVLLPGVMAAAGYTANLFTVIVFPLVGAVHLTFLVHVASAFGRASAEDAGDPISGMLGRTFKACTFAALTTIAGLASLGLSEVPQVREFGLLGAGGIAISWMMTFGPGMALLRLMPRVTGTGRRAEDGTGEWSGRLARFSERRRGLILGLAATVLAVSAVGLAHVRTDIRVIEFLGKNSLSRQAAEEFDRAFGGINAVQIEFDSGAVNGANQLPFLRYVESVHRHAASLPDVSGVYSHPQLLGMMNQVWEGGGTETLRLPSSALRVQLFVLALRTYDHPFMEALADREFRTAYLVVRTRGMPAGRYLEILRDITAYAERNRPEGVRVSAETGIHTLLEADRRIMRSQIGSVMTTTLAIFLLLAFLWRSVPLAAIGIACNLLPVAILFAIAGAAGIPLNSLTVMAGAVVLGIAVDDAVHFGTHWRDEIARGKGRGEAIRAALRVKMRPMLCTSLILMAVFGGLLLSSFPPVIHFGLLSVAGFAAAFAAVVVLLPAMLGGRERRDGSRLAPVG